MRYLRKSAGKTKRDRIRNHQNRKELRQEPITNIIEIKGLRFLVRISEDRKPEQILEDKRE